MKNLKLIGPALASKYRLYKRSNILIFIVFITLPLIMLSCSKNSKDSDSFDNESFESSQPEEVGSANQRVSLCDTKDLDKATMNNLSNLFLDFSVSKRAELSNLHLRSSKNVSIPVVFHVISEGPTFEEGEVSDDYLIEQIEVLNRAYTGEMGGFSTPFKFSLGGINRVRNKSWHTISLASEKELEIKTALRMGGAETLNVYLADIVVEGEKGKILGYSSLPVLYRVLPEMDGIVLNFRAVPGGPLERYNLGHTLVHEAGHWLGLLHTFTGGCDGFFTDLISDTARHELPKTACPKTDYDSCPNDLGADPSHNHMNYTVDSCRYEFTQGQVDFMTFNAILFRGLAVF